jgi:hypothetical protein
MVYYGNIPQGSKHRATEGTSNKVLMPWGKNRYSVAFYASNSTISGTSVTISGAMINEYTKIVATPTTQHSGTRWWVTKADGSFTLHSNTSEDNVTFDYYISNARIY